MWYKNCPKCNNIQKYKVKGSLTNALKNNAWCRKCKQAEVSILRNKKSGLKNKLNGKFKGKNNPMYNRTIYEVWLEKYGKEEAEQRRKNHANNSARKGEKNGMYGRSFYSIWLGKYGKEEADKKYEEWKLKIGNSGDKNGMFGKPAPKGSGNGMNGHFNNMYFRSFLELKAIIYMLDNNILFESAETKNHAIQYTFENKPRNYFCDFYLPNTNEYIEVKPSAMLKLAQNVAKFDAAKTKHNIKFIIKTEKDIPNVSQQRLLEFIHNGSLTWSIRSQQKWEKLLK